MKRLDELETADLLALAEDVQKLTKAHLEDPIGFYSPHIKQVPFHSSPKRNRWFFAANASGKTIGGAAESLWFTLGRHPYRDIITPCHGWVASDNFAVLQEGAMRSIMQLVPPSEVLEYSKREATLYLRNGSTIGFKSYDAGRESFQAAEKNFVWFDEEPPLAIYEECMARVMRTAGDIWGTMTPLKGLSWAYKQLYLDPKDPELVHFEATIYDNPYLSPEEVERFEAQMTNQYQRKARLMGKFTPLSGLSYFDPEDVEAKAKQIRTGTMNHLIHVGTRRWALQEVR